MDIMSDNDCKCRAKKAPVSFSTHPHCVAAEGPPSQPQLAASGPLAMVATDVHHSAVWQILTSGVLGCTGSNEVDECRRRRT
eukprot:CAMPEP_0194526906 /NCGR_PEP_ID=MMETSP0253-20130528/62841_1 /TAXON_ID=2966 /ORGANISM="Noctiluca scintillans" /LENGTH=81 /DNA_ID=CAMNT_0039371769 /DNA_START=13 /DNA_END=254 /DNA_ORIENTATION=+